MKQGNKKWHDIFLLFSQGTTLRYMYVSCKPRLQFCQIEAMFMVNSMLVELQLSKCFPITEIASKKAITRSRGISCHVIEQLAVVIELQSHASRVPQK